MLLPFFMQLNQPSSLTTANGLMSAIGTFHQFIMRRWLDNIPNQGPLLWNICPKGYPLRMSANWRRDRRKMTRFLAFLLPFLALSSAVQAFCDPPVAPPRTSADVAREYQEEFRQEFEYYFSDAQRYMRCLELERTNVMDDIQDTAERYDRFLKDSDTWVD